jgi:hypothetical protein
LVEPREFKLSALTKRTIIGIFETLKEEILSNYISKIQWLKYCYGIQNASFINLAHMETVPMSKFVVMVKIHEEAVDQIKGDLNTDIEDSGN